MNGTDSHHAAAKRGAGDRDRGYCSRVTDFILSDDQNQVQGIKVRNESSHQEELMMSELVVDASGAGSQTLKWLNAEDDSSERVDIDLFYATRFYKTEWMDRGWTNLMISAQLP